MPARRSSLCRQSLRARNGQNLPGGGSRGIVSGKIYRMFESPVSKPGGKSGRSSGPAVWPTEGDWKSI